MSVRISFLFITCQIGAESALKTEMAESWPHFKFSYSRPGFVTYKLPEHFQAQVDFDLKSAFARSWSFSLRKAVGDSEAERIDDLLRLAQENKTMRIHVWNRTETELGSSGLLQIQNDFKKKNSSLKAGDLIFDVVLVEENEWWLGWHFHSPKQRFWPEAYAGALLPLELPEAAPSRAYLKLEEGLSWSALPVQSNDACIEFGSAPGGASYALLQRGLDVIGVDPGEMSPAVLSHPRYRHLKLQALQVKSEQLTEIQWIFSDMNVPPVDALKVVQKLAHHKKLLGGLLTLKLKDWKTLEPITHALTELQSLGFKRLRVAHLVSNRTEVCAAFLTPLGLEREQALLHSLHQAPSDNGLKVF